MAQETRKDPRAKVLTMTVRYKSATLDEFIEHHSHDVSRGGMFIKTPQPFPPGTLLKFEVKIAEDQKVIQGVGRVVWKRDGEPGDRERPSGMGVKFIKIDDLSRKTIDQLVGTRAGAGAAYEAGGGDGGGLKTVPSVTPPAVMTPPVPEATAGKAPRKATMIGLGAMGAAAAAKAAAEPTPSTPPAADNFFPHGDSQADMPPPEDRTVMKQAAELLKDALREAGGSMEDLGKPEAKPSEPPKPAEPARESLPTQPDLDVAPATAATASQKSVAPSTQRSEAPPSGMPEKKPEPKPSVRPAAAVARSERPSAAPRAASARPQAILSEAPPASEGGGGRVMLILGLIAVAAGAVFYFTQKPPTPAPTPAPTAAAPPAPTPEPVAPPSAVEPAPAEAPSAAPSAAVSVAPAPSAAPSASVAPVAAPTPPAAVEPKPAPVVPPPAPAPAPKPVVAPKPKPKPAAAEPGGETSPAPAAPPAEPKPAPAPKPKPAEPAGDNPY